MDLTKWILDACKEDLPDLSEVRDRYDAPCIAGFAPRVLSLRVYCAAQMLDAPSVDLIGEGILNGNTLLIHFTTAQRVPGGEPQRLRIPVKVDTHFKEDHTCVVTKLTCRNGNIMRYAVITGEGCELFADGDINNGRSRPRTSRAQKIFETLQASQLAPAMATETWETSPSRGDITDIASRDLFDTSRNPAVGIGALLLTTMLVERYGLAPAPASVIASGVIALAYQ